ncbi:hypothetical protein HSR122_3049 [Halapricum desulfuricans]|uniref:Uncharacterized protein n=1 Tax=Halapricum desulfuricans TaxID=2841257 RepID=A0A897ND44_9EURY|nr:hypothetical protein HSR122_3049 [Halapricum desulfuricans]
MVADVVPDDEALVGYQVRKDIEVDESESGFPEFIVTAGENEERTLVTVTNRLGEDTAIEIVNVEVTTQSDGEPNVVNVEWDKGSFGPGEIADIRGKIACEKAGSDVVELTVTVESAGVTASLFGATDTRRFVVRCESESLPDLTSDFLSQGKSGESSAKVTFNGLGQVTLNHDEPGTVDVQFYVGSKTGANKQMSVDTHPSETIKTNQKVSGDTFTGESVVGVRIAGSDAIYLHPSWNQDGCKFDNGSGGIVSRPASIEDIDPIEC